MYLAGVVRNQRALFARNWTPSRRLTEKQLNDPTLPKGKVMASITNKLRSKRNDLISTREKIKSVFPDTDPVLYQNKQKKKQSSFLYFTLSKSSNLPSTNIQNQMDFFLFEDGVIVSWGAEKAHSSTLLKLLGLEYNQNTAPSPNVSAETMDSHSIIELIDDEIIKIDYGEEANVDEKKDTWVLTEKNRFWEEVTYSIALVRSIKLDEIELETDNAVNRALNLKFSSPSGIKTTPRAELAYLYNLSYNLTVKSRIVEFPSILWEKENSFHELYHKACRYLDIDTRVEVVQKKMKLPTNYWMLENEHASSIISWRLEKMIIWLIAIEILFQVLGKSESWEDFSWEKGIRKLLGLPEPKSEKEGEEKVKNLFGEEYQIVEQKYEIIKPNYNK
eukprot:TRINITY_DN1004_c0_g2_i1.p1 TRINITY_DN1004_c0_g2~~TRINITY_DN1004_c0_g2_i1.p1  ORF type:complete len:407 (+),score=108.57 TRINITY_DN1004_c0_g2_i1:53-1222(+)